MANDKIGLKPGTKLGETTIRRHIGSGGMGHVYRGSHPKYGKVAIKVLDPHLARFNKRAATRFLREARLASKLSHENLVQVYEIGSRENYYFIIMEYVRGETARGLVERKGPLSWKRATLIISAVCRVLTKAEDLGIIHRDIKPENILLSEKGEVKLADLGLAKQLDDEEGIEVTMANQAVGTYWFMSPEQCRDSRDVDIRADIFCLGGTFYTLLTSKLPFRGKSPFEVMTHIMEDEIRNPILLNPDIPKEILNILWKMTRKDVADRYQTAADLLDDLEGAQRGFPVNAPPGFGSVREKPKDPATEILHKKDDGAFRNKKKLFSGLLAGVAILALLFWGAKAFLFNSTPTVEIKTPEKSPGKTVALVSKTRATPVTVITPVQTPPKVSLPTVTTEKKTEIKTLDILPTNDTEPEIIPPVKKPPEDPLDEFAENHKFNKEFKFSTDRELATDLEKGGYGLVYKELQKQVDNPAAAWRKKLLEAVKERMTADLEIGTTGVIAPRPIQMLSEKGKGKITLGGETKFEITSEDGLVTVNIEPDTGKVSFSMSIKKGKYAHKYAETLKNRFTLINKGKEIVLLAQGISCRTLDWLSLRYSTSNHRPRKHCFENMNITLPTSSTKLYGVAAGITNITKGKGVFVTGKEKVSLSIKLSDKVISILKNEMLTQPDKCIELEALKKQVPVNWNLVKSDFFKMERNNIGQITKRIEFLESITPFLVSEVNKKSVAEQIEKEKQTFSEKRLIEINNLTELAVIARRNNNSNKFNEVIFALSALKPGGKEIGLSSYQLFLSKYRKNLTTVLDITFNTSGKAPADASVSKTVVFCGGNSLLLQEHIFFKNRALFANRKSWVSLENNKAFAQTTDFTIEALLKLRNNGSRIIYRSGSNNGSWFLAINNSELIFGKYDKEKLLNNEIDKMEIAIINHGLSRGETAAIAVSVFANDTVMFRINGKEISNPGEKRKFIFSPSTGFARIGSALSPFLPAGTLEIMKLRVTTGIMLPQDLLKKGTAPGQ